MKTDALSHAALVDAVHHAIPVVPRKVVALILDRYLAEVAAALATGEGARLRGLGTLRTKSLPERVVRHPQTGDDVTVPAKKKVTFRAAAALKARLGPA